MAGDNSIRAADRANEDQGMTEKGAFTRRIGCTDSMTKAEKQKKKEEHYVNHQDSFASGGEWECLSGAKTRSAGVMGVRG